MIIDNLEAHTNLKPQHKSAIPTIFTNFLTEKVAIFSQLTKIPNLSIPRYGIKEYNHLRTLD